MPDLTSDLDKRFPRLAIDLSHLDLAVFFNLASTALVFIYAKINMKVCMSVPTRSDG